MIVPIIYGTHFYCSIKFIDNVTLLQAQRILHFNATLKLFLNDNHQRNDGNMKVNRPKSDFHTKNQ